MILLKLIMKATFCTHNISYHDYCAVNFGGCEFEFSSTEVMAFWAERQRQ